MQKVAWPMMIVQIEKLMPSGRLGRLESEAGDDARQRDGQDDENEIVSLPKKQ